MYIDIFVLCNMEKWDGEMGMVAWEIFLLGAENLIKSDFDLLNLFQSQKQHSVNIEHQLKLKLVWPVCTRSMKLK